MNIDLQSRDIPVLRHTFAHVAQRIGPDKVASRYQEATIGAQPSANFHYRPTWDPSHTLFDASRSAIELDDWYVLRDPRQFYYANWSMTRARQQEAVEANFQFVDTRGMVGALADEVLAQALKVLVPLRHVAWGGNMNNAAICAYGYGTALTAPAMFHAMDQLGIAQMLTRAALLLATPDVLDVGKQAWLTDPHWQDLRRYVEDSWVEPDPMALFVAQNLALDGWLYPLIYEHFVDEQLMLKGGSAVAMLTSFMPEWFAESRKWVDAVVKTAAAASEGNRDYLSQWTRTWGARAQAALEPVAELALGAQARSAMDDVQAAWRTRVAQLGLAL